MKRKRNRLRRLTASLLAAVFVLTPLQLDRFATIFIRAQIDESGYEYIDEDTVWSKGEHLVEKGVFVDSGATLTIEKGARIIFKKTSPENPFIQIDDGRIVAAGAQDEKISFSAADQASKNYYISFNDVAANKVSFFRYVDFASGGMSQGAGQTARKNNSFFNVAFAADLAGYGTFQYYAGQVHLENSTFEDSEYFPVTVDSRLSEGSNRDGFLQIVNSNFGINTNNLAVSSTLQCAQEIPDCPNRILLKNNWYGDKLGPKTETSILSAGREVFGDFVLDGWKSDQLIADPIVIVPGIMGSSQSLGEWKLDPITHVYDDLVQSLRDNGYEDGVNLFEFTYDWRINNETTAHYLQSKVEGVLINTKVSKVDVVAHSMGGLVARAYIEEVGGAIYENTIDQLITLGTPHKGSVLNYLRWEAGEGFFTWNDRLVRYHFSQEAEEAGYEDLGKYIREKVPSAKELLPDYDYLSDGSTSRQYPDNYPRNTFLEELNEDKNVEKLQKVDYTNIVGTSYIDNTISKIRIGSGTVNGSWEHGMSENFYDSETDRGLTYGIGDETVPESSAKGISADRTIVMEATHGALPTTAQCEVFRELAGQQDCQYDEDWHMDNVLLFNVFSPIDIQIVSPSGKRVGKNFETGGEFNEIPGAYYTGYGTENEFITIPNPEEGEYRVLTQGTGNGTYRVEVTRIVDGGEAQEVMENTLKINGVASEGKKESVQVKVAGNVIANLSQSNSKPADPPVGPPVVLPANPPAENNNGNVQNPAPAQIANKVKKKHKKSKHKKKRKKSKISQVVTKTKKVLGISTGKSSRRPNIFAKTWKNASRSATSTWNNVRQAPNKVKDFFSSKFSFFKIRK